MAEYFLIKDTIYKEYYCQSEDGIIWTFLKNIKLAYKFTTELDAEKKILYLFKNSIRLTHYIILKKNN